MKRFSIAGFFLALTLSNVIPTTASPGAIVSATVRNMAAAAAAKAEARCEDLVDQQLVSTGAAKEALGRRLIDEGCAAHGFSAVQEPRLERGGVCERLKAVLDDLLIAKELRDEAADTFRNICM